MDFHEIIMKGKFQLETLNKDATTPASAGRMVYYGGNLYYETGSGGQWHELVSSGNFADYFDLSDLNNYYTKTQSDSRYLQITNFNTTFDSRVTSQIEPTYLKKSHYSYATNGMTLSQYNGYIINSAHSYYNLPGSPTDRGWIYFSTTGDMESSTVELRLNGKNFKGENIAALTVDKNVPFGIIYTSTPSGWGWYFC